MWEGCGGGGESAAQETAGCCGDGVLLIQQEPASAYEGGGGVSQMENSLRSLYNIESNPFIIIILNGIGCRTVDRERCA